MELLTKQETLELFEALHAEIRDLRGQLARPVVDDKAHMSRKQAAEYLDMSLKSLDAHAASGEIRRAKFGDGRRARVLYRKVDLDDFVARHLEMDNAEARRIVRRAG